VVAFDGEQLVAADKTCASLSLAACSQLEMYYQRQDLSVIIFIVGFGSKRQAFARLRFCR